MDVCSEVDAYRRTTRIRHSVAGATCWSVVGYAVTCGGEHSVERSSMRIDEPHTAIEVSNIKVSDRPWVPAPA
jgi:hypothetical protein